MYKNLDLQSTAKYKCPKCNCPVFKAEDESGKRIFVHRTCNDYADHAKHCPNRKPDVQPDLMAVCKESIFEEELIITKPETIEVSAEQFKKYEKRKTAPKKAGKEKGVRPKKASPKKPSKPKNKAGAKPLRTNKRATAGRSKSN